MAFYAGGSIYASLNSASGGGGTGCLLYEIKPFLSAGDGSMSSALIRNEIFFNGGGAGNVYYCTQQPDPEGNVTTVFNYSDSGSYASLAYVSRRTAQPPGTLPDSGLTLVAGAATYTSLPVWGFHTATAPAGLVSGGGTGGFPTFWFAGMYAKSDGTWGTAIGRNGYNINTQD
jgi:hypothetical protein